MICFWFNNLAQNYLATKACRMTSVNFDNDMCQQLHQTFLSLSFKSRAFKNYLLILIMFFRKNYHA